jgi:peptide/nickel transport system permease protein
MAITLLVVSLAIFAVTEILPGDVAEMMLGIEATPERLEIIREKLDLNRPWAERYLDWIGHAVTGDLGESYVIQKPITDIVPRRLNNSLMLAVFALLFGIPTAIAAGIWAGVRSNRLFDRVMSTIGVIGISLPEFVTGILLIFIFSSTFNLLPPSSIMLPGETPLSRPEILIMPAMTLTTVLFGYIMRMTRASVIEVMETPYVRTAVLKGLPMRTVIRRHVLPNAMLPTISIIAMNFGWMLGGLIITEAVFAYPGLGLMLLVAIQQRDVPLLEALSLIIAGAYIMSNLVADLSYAALDPRIRLA